MFCQCLFFIATPERIVFLSTVKSDHGPHFVIMRVKLHLGTPDEIQDGEFIRHVNSIYAGLGWLANCGQQIFREDTARSTSS